MDVFKDLLNDIAATESRIQIKKQQRQVLNKQKRSSEYFLTLFKDLFKTHRGQAYSCNVAKDKALLKRLNETYSDSLESMIEIYISQYAFLAFTDIKKFPAPTVGGLSVLANSVYSVINKEESNEVSNESESLIF